MCVFVEMIIQLTYLRIVSELPKMYVHLKGDWTQVIWVYLWFSYFLCLMTAILFSILLSDILKKRRHYGFGWGE
jgi:uncharacterized membrane protein